MAVPLLLAALMPASPIRFDPTTMADAAEVNELDRVHDTLTFRSLSALSLPGDRAARTLPVAILALDGRRVVVEGYMMALDMTTDGVSRFMLTGSFDTCLFGIITPVTGRIDVTMTRGRRTLVSHLPIRVYGTLHVRTAVEDGWLVGLYQMDGEAVDFGGTR
jgi:hypothetical protein